MIIDFHKTSDLSGSSYVKFPLRTSAILNIENEHKDYFIWSKLASVLPCETSHPERFSDYRDISDELNIDGFQFSNAFESIDVYTFEKPSNLSINIIESSFFKIKTNRNTRNNLLKTAKMIQIKLLTY